MSKQEKINTTYKEYLDTLTKEELNSILSFYNIKFKKNIKKESLIDLIMDNLNNIVNKSTEVFQDDELANIKLVIKKKGLVEVRLNYLLYDFLETLTRNHLIIKKDTKLFYMPKEILSLFNKKVNNKNVLEHIKNNTEEYKLLMGFIDAYGVVDFDLLYSNYSKEYKLKKDAAVSRISFLSDYYKEFKIFKDKNKLYVASNIINNLKECKIYIKKKENYKLYTNEELANIHTFKYMESYKSYKKLVKYIRANYEVSKNSTKIINKWVMIPYLAEYQLDKNTAKEKLVKLLEEYFEFKNDKQKNKFLNLAEDMAMDYPNWRCNGYSEKEHV